MSCNHNITDLPDLTECKNIGQPNKPGKILMDPEGRVHVYDSLGHYLYSGKGIVEKDGTISFKYDEQA